MGGGANRDLAGLSKIGSMGDLAAMFTDRDCMEGDRRADAEPMSVPAAKAKRDSGVETPPLGGTVPAGETEMAQLGEALEAGGRAAKRLRA